MNQNVRRITDGAMISALIGMVVLIDRQLGGQILGMFLFLIPLPMVFYSTKYGLKASWVVWAAVVLLSMMLATPQMVILVAAESLIGMIYGDGTRKNVPVKKLLLLTMGLGVLVNVFSTIIVAKFFGYDLVKEVAEMEQMANNLLNQVGLVLPAGLDLKQFLLSVLIVTTLLTGVLEGYLTHIFGRLLLKRFRVPVTPIQPVGTYFPPVWTGYAGLGLFVLYFYLIAHPLENYSNHILAVSICMVGILYLVAYGAIYFMLVLALYNGKHKGWNVLFSLLFITLFMNPCAILGFFYITTDAHRKLLEKGGYYATKNE